MRSHVGGDSDSRYIALLGDAELDEGSIWENIGDPHARTVGNVPWIIDLNRQSLDRVVPGKRVAQLEKQFAAAE